MFEFPQTVWRAFINWLMKPIAFPGRWDINQNTPARYNKEATTLNQVHDCDER
jgi:hypothetical protein